MVSPSFNSLESSLSRGGAGLGGGILLPPSQNKNRLNSVLLNASVFTLSIVYASSFFYVVNLIAERIR